MDAVVASRPHAAKAHCAACERYLRCALIWVDRLGAGDVRKPLRLCSGCCRSAWDAAKQATPRRGKGGRP